MLAILRRIPRPIGLTAMVALLPAWTTAPEAFATAAEWPERPEATAGIVVDLGEDLLTVRSLVPERGGVLTVVAPDGRSARRSFAPGQSFALSLAEAFGEPPPEGRYGYSAYLTSAPDSDRPKGGDQPRRRDAPPASSGGFELRDGAVQPRRTPPAAPAPRAPDSQVISDNLVVVGKSCVGTSCAPAETWGSGDTMKVKDLSSSLVFDNTVTHRWQLQANWFGTNFALRDVNSSTMPVTVADGAPDRALAIDAAGNVGFGTAVPTASQHLRGSNPRLNFEDVDTGRLWQVYPDQVSFSIFDVTAATLPFDIAAGAPSGSLRVGANGDLGIGTGTPSSALHVLRGDGSAKLLVQETNGTVIGRNLFQLKNNGPATFRFDNTANGTFWGFGQIVAGNKFFVSAGGAPSLGLTLDGGGNLAIAGTLTQNSDRDSKDGLASVDPREVLQRVVGLPIQTWHYRSDGAHVRHFGPMAQDFAEAFGLGDDDRHIAPLDVGGVALAAIQALQHEVAEKDAALEAQAARLQALEAGNSTLAGQFLELGARLRQLEQAQATARP